MNKLLTKKSVIIAVLCLAALCCFVAAQSPIAGTNENSAPTHKVTIRYMDPDSQEVLSSETVWVSEGGMIFTADEARAEELCILTIQRLDSNGQEDGEAETVPLPAGTAYAVNMSYTVSAPDPDPIPDLPAPPVASTSATATAASDQQSVAKSPAELKGLAMNKTEEHETIDSLIEKGVMTPYQIPGFPVAGPFWEKYGMAPDSKSAPIA